jgi:hypothetical protein
VGVVPHPQAHALPMQPPSCFDWAPLGAYSSDEGGLHRPPLSESNSMLENCRRTPIGVLSDPLKHPALRV